MSAIALKAIAAWLLILVCAVLNGALREAVLVPQLGQFAGLIASGLLLCLFVLSVSVAWCWAVSCARPITCSWPALAMPHAFEFGLAGWFAKDLGHAARGYTSKRQLVRLCSSSPHSRR
jgi:hypothetical protein